MTDVYDIDISYLNLIGQKLVEKLTIYIASVLVEKLSRKAFKSLKEYIQEKENYDNRIVKAMKYIIDNYNIELPTTTSNDTPDHIEKRKSFHQKKISNGRDLNFQNRRKNYYFLIPVTSNNKITHYDVEQITDYELSFMLKTNVNIFSRSKLDMSDRLFLLRQKFGCSNNKSLGKEIDINSYEIDDTFYLEGNLDKLYCFEKDPYIIELLLKMNVNPYNCKELTEHQRLYI